jgi:hypothetical protein
MGHGGLARRFAVLAIGVGVTFSLAPARAGAVGAQTGDDDPILPPAEDGDVQIAPVDEPADPGDTVPVDARESAADEDGGRGLDPADLVGPWGLLALVSVGLTVVTATRLRRMVHLWLSPVWLRQSGFGDPAEETTTSFSLLVPARREDPVLGRALDRLAELDHPAYEVLVIVGRDDPFTHDIAIAAAARHPERIRVIAENNFHESASTALNTALDVCRGEYVGVFEAGDKVHRKLLRSVDTCLATTGADVLQGGVQILDLDARWFGIRNVVERYFWFRSRLHFHAHQGFTPLDVTTVFIRTAVVRDAGGWDEGCVAENCELGVRLSVDGVPTAVAYEPELATRRLCPDRTRDLLRQQTRAVQGYLQVLKAGVWKRLPEGRQRLLARAALLRPLVEALTGAAVVITLAAALLGGAPPIVVLAALLPAVPVLMTVVVEMAGLAELSRTHGSGIGLRDYIRLVVTAVPYWLVSAVGAVRAVLAVLRPRRTRNRSGDGSKVDDNEVGFRGDTLPGGAGHGAIGPAPTVLAGDPSWTSPPTGWERANAGDPSWATATDVWGRPIDDPVQTGGTVAGWPAGWHDPEEVRAAGMGQAWAHTEDMVDAGDAGDAGRVAEAAEQDEPAAHDEHVERQYGGRYAVAATTGEHDVTIDLAGAGSWAGVGALVPSYQGRRNSRDPGWPTGWGSREDDTTPSTVAADSGWPLVPAAADLAPGGQPSPPDQAGQVAPTGHSDQVTEVAPTGPSAQPTPARRTAPAQGSNGPGVIPGGRRKPVWSDGPDAGPGPEPEPEPGDDRTRTRPER